MKKMTIIIGFLNLMLLTPSLFSNPMLSPSYDCNVTLSSVEKRICKDTQLMTLDNHLSGLYKKAMMKTSLKKVLRSYQRAWIRQRSRCHDITCIKQCYHARIEELQIYLNQ